MQGKLQLLLQSQFEALTPDLQRDIYIEYYHLVYATVIYMTKDHSATEDIIQDSFLKVIKHAPRIENEGSLNGWIRAIVRNTTYSYFRKNKKYRDEINSESVYINNTVDYATDQDAISKEVELNLLVEHLTRYLHELKPDYRAIVELRWKHGLSYKEIAEQLDTTDRVIKHKLHRARESLKKRFIRDWGDEH